MRTIKAFYKDERGYYCNHAGTKYYFEVGKTYKANGEIRLGKNGFHASANFDISETVDYYVTELAHYGIVELNVIDKDMYMAVGDIITVLEILPNDFDVLSMYDRTGEWIYYAGRNWRQFDFEKGFKKLAEIDRTGAWMHLAGKHWKYKHPNAK